MSDPWDPKSDAYAQTLEDYQALLALEYDEAVERYRSKHVVNPLGPGETSLDAETVAILEMADFRPTVRTHSRMPGGSTADTESWVDATGATAVEVGISPSSVSGRHFVSTYFADGTAITVWPSDSVTAGTTSERRENLRGVDDLASDIPAALAARDERLASGSRPLLMVDVETANLHHEIHARFLQADPVQAALDSLDTTGLWKIRARVQAMFLLFVLVSTGVSVLVFGPNPIVLALGGAGTLYTLASLIRTWMRRNEPFDPFKGMSREELEAMLFSAQNPEDGD